MNAENARKIKEAKQKSLMNSAKKKLGEDAAADSSVPQALPFIGKHKDRGLENIEGETEGIVDHEAYKEWRRLKRLPILNDLMEVKCSDGSTVNLAWFPTFFKRRTEHLPAEECETLAEKQTIYKKTHHLAMMAKNKAYGYQNVKRAQEASAAKNKEVGFLKSRKPQIIELFGKMFSIEEVHKIIVEEWDFPVSMKEVTEFKRNNLAVIQEKQEIHKASHSDLRLTTKRSRLEELTYLYNRLNDKIKITVNREDVRVMTSILVEIRREIEGEKITINGKFDINIEANINDHLQKEVFKEFSLTQIIIGKVASRMRVNAARIVQGLSNSYYARFNRFIGAEPEDIDWEEIEYPSQMGFDFEKIAQRYAEKEVVYARETAAIKKAEADSSVRVAQSGLKAALMAKLAEKTGDVKREKLLIDGAELTRKKEQLILDKVNLFKTKE